MCECIRLARMLV